MIRQGTCPTCHEPVRRVRGVDGAMHTVELTPLQPGTIWPDDQSGLWSHTIAGWKRGVIEHYPVYAAHTCPDLTDSHNPTGEQ